MPTDQFDKTTRIPHNAAFILGCRFLGERPLANSAQARKRARQAETHRLHNAGLRNKMRTYIKKVVTAIETGDKSQAEQRYKDAVPVIDSMVGKGIVHKNKAARHKSRLNQRIRALAS